jgi:HSP20 family molecular chaperone IbpA
MAALTALGSTPHLPADASLEESASEYLIHLAVPGFAADDLDVEVADHVVTVRGDRTRADLGEFRLHERLEERLELPYDVDSGALRASYRLDELDLHAPRLAEGSPPPRKVRIERPFEMNADASGV